MKNTDDLLNPYYIRDSLSLESKMLVPVIQVYEEVDSTNNVLMQKNCIYPNGHACFAENQYKGRGLSNKSWIAAQSNVCFSVANCLSSSTTIPLFDFSYKPRMKIFRPSEGSGGPRRRQWWKKNM